MTENKKLWLYNNIYYDNEVDAVTQLVKDYPNATLSQYLDLAYENISVIYEATIIPQDLDTTTVM